MIEQRENPLFVVLPWTFFLEKHLRLHRMLESGEIIFVPRDRMVRIRLFRDRPFSIETGICVC